MAKILNPIIESHVAKVQEKLIPAISASMKQEYDAASIPQEKRDTLSVHVSRKFAKVVRTFQGREPSVYAMVALEAFSNKSGSVSVGDIFRPASENAPAKEARAKLDDESTWIGAFSVEGVRKLPAGRKNEVTA